MFVSTFGPGMSMGMPDVCMTPPFAIPTPYPNIGANAMAIPTYYTVCTNAMPDLNMTGQYAITNGDQAGAMGGVASGMIMGPGRCLMGSQVMFVAGQPVWRMLSPTLQNMTNAPGVSLVPSQFTKLVLR